MRRLRRRYGRARESTVVREIRKRWPPGTRFVYAKAGEMYRQAGTVEHVRPDGWLIVRFDSDPPGAIRLVGYTNDIAPEGTILR